MTSNLIIDGFRKARKARKDHVDYLETIQEDSLARSAQQAVDYEYFLGQALEKLEKNSTPWNWKVFSVRVLGLKSAKEAGEELGTTPGNVDTICCRMKIMLKGVWSELILESNEGGVDAGHLANKLYLEPLCKTEEELVAPQRWRHRERFQVRAACLVLLRQGLLL